ncbi:MAG: hypothetical protein HY075_14200 [Deltaproteobacteria bacterium]|nr:hypothetical protein [Deltaproteobacteria bacterium]
MRGFRANRANQNSKAARFGHRSDGFQPKVIEGGHDSDSAHHPQQPQKQLPQWLRMPAEPARSSMIKTVAKPVAKAPAVVERKLKLVEPLPAQKTKTAKTAKTAAPRAKKTTTGKTSKKRVVA